MKYIFNLCALALPIVCVPLILHAQQSQPATAPELRTQNLHFEPKVATPDDEMLEVARAADVNLFMDATDVTEKPSIATTRAPGKTDWELEHLISNLTAERRLAWKIDPSNRSLLISAEPNIKVLRQQLLQGPGIEVAQPKMDEATFTARLIDYLQREQGLESEEKAWNRTLAIAELPADLKDEMLVRTQKGLLNQSLGGVSMLRNFISDDTWSRARIAMAPKSSMLYLILPTEHSTITHQLTPSPQQAGGTQ